MLGVLVLASVLSVNLEEKNWKALNYSNIAPNENVFDSTGIRVKVNNSAGPLIQPLKVPMTVNRMKSAGHLGGLPNIPSQLSQGQKGADDFPLRIGLVQNGAKRLNAFQRLIAAQWVKELFQSVPSDSGIEKIIFSNISSGASKVTWSTRIHPASELISEQIVGHHFTPGPYKLDVPFVPPLEIVAIWISVDGDDTKSSFTTHIKSLELDVQSSH